MLEASNVYSKILGDVCTTPVGIEYILRFIKLQTCKPPGFKERLLIFAKCLIQLIVSLIVVNYYPHLDDPQSGQVKHPS